ncbi:TonB-dependent receptor [Sphingomonas sp. CGMCC 1.13654]|uniref:TonB-dependent receptor n=1 Tax=Sphingomonas chungangi TaxID=2683589 RepID=A0A838LBK4_9SPHN|nr:TonB-dependent receptor [Sphingomonas chungangi]MBA2934868.1 TonB-dependent receptor [Sphingomonas chungangi]MVW58179.1 TonB-dependent receptor [Sphingomonas chungangi]
MTSRHRLRAPLLAAAALSTPAFAAGDAPPGDILVTAQKQQESIENAPVTRATIDAKTIGATVNAVNVEDTVKYLPSLIVRKRHIGDTQAPLATRTSGLGASARSLIYADGVLLSSLIGNNNTLASPRWSLVSPQEIARIDVLYGPFSAAYPGNSIGAVVNITTRLPDKLEATATAGTSVQRFGQYGTKDTLPSYQYGATIGDRFGPLAVFVSVDHVTSHGQPLTYVTANKSGACPSGAFDALNKNAMPICVLGASGLETQRQDHIKLKAALDVTPVIRLTYVGGLFLNQTHAHAETYLADGAYTSGFSSGIYDTDQRHWSHSLSATGASGRLDWQVIGTLYDFARDRQAVPTGLLPAASSGEPGNVTRLDGTGWRTLDAKAVWRPIAAHAISFGAHGDWFRLDSNRYATTEWLGGDQGALNLQSKGRTRTAAIWAQDAWTLLPHLTLTAGGRYEWWKAYDGRNFSLSPFKSVDQPELSANRFSPKASLAWAPYRDWTIRASFGEAWRFPTVGELYQLVVTPPVAAIPDPNLKPERALSEELAIERHDAHGSIRLSLFNEVVKDALISQTGTLNGAAATFVQNVPRTRARGIELAVNRTDLLPRVDLSGSVTYADAETRSDPALPAAEGKLLPSVPRWKATLVGTWRPTDAISLTAAGRYSSRNYGALDNSDVVGNTYGGFYKYLVVDLRAQVKAGEHMTFAVGVDNVNNDKYFLFHPFPQRTVFAQAEWQL